MAYGVTKLAETVHGNQRVLQLLVAADAVSGIVETGFTTVITAMMTPKSMASAGVKVKVNATTAAAASQGKVNIQDAASGDDFYLNVYGR